MQHSLVFTNIFNTNSQLRQIRNQVFHPQLLKNHPQFIQQEILNLLLLTKRYLSLCRALIFFFVLLHTPVRQVRNQYIIIYTMRKHNFTWTSFFNCLIILLSFLLFKHKITYYNTTSHCFVSLSSILVTDKKPSKSL